MTAGDKIVSTVGWKDVEGRVTVKLTLGGNRARKRLVIKALVKLLRYEPRDGVHLMAH